MLLLLGLTARPRMQIDTSKVDCSALEYRIYIYIPPLLSCATLGEFRFLDIEPNLSMRMYPIILIAITALPPHAYTLEHRTRGPPDIIKGIM